MVVGRDTIFQTVGSLCRSSMPIFGSSGAIKPARDRSTNSISGPPSLAICTKPIPLGLGNLTGKGYNGLVKIAFESLTLVYSVSSLSPEHLCLCISTLGQFGHQPNINIALTASSGASLMSFSRSGRTSTRRRNTASYGCSFCSSCSGYVRIHGPKCETGRSRRCSG